MDAVSEVLIARTPKADGPSSMPGPSMLAHVVLLALCVFLAAWWFVADQQAPEMIMQVSLGGPLGPNDGGLNTLGASPVQQLVESKKAIEPVRPPAEKTPEMIEP